MDSYLNTGDGEVSTVDLIKNKDEEVDQKKRQQNAIIGFMKQKSRRLSENIHITAN